MDLNEIKSAIRLYAKKWQRRGKDIEFLAKSSSTGKKLASALYEFANKSGFRLKEINTRGSYKDFELEFFTVSGATDFAQALNLLLKDRTATTTPALGAGQGAVSYNGNDTNKKTFWDVMSGLGNFASNMVDKATTILGNKGDDEIEMYKAQLEIEQQQAEQERRRTILTVGAIGGALLIVLVIVLTLGK